MGFKCDPKSLQPGPEKEAFGILSLGYAGEASLETPAAMFLTGKRMWSRLRAQFSPHRGSWRTRGPQGSETQVWGALGHRETSPPTPQTLTPFRKPGSNAAGHRHGISSRCGRRSAWPPRFGVQTLTAGRRSGAGSGPRKSAAPAQDPGFQAPQAAALPSREAQSSYSREHNRCKFQHIGPPPRAPTAIAASRARRGHRLRDPNLGCASAPCGRPAPDPAGLRRQKRPARGPRRKLEPRGREGGSSAPRAWLGLDGARATPGRRAQARPGSRPPTWRAARPHVEGAEEEGGRRERRPPGRCGGTRAPAAQAPALREGLPGGAGPASARRTRPPRPPAAPVCTFPEPLIPRESRFVVARERPRGAGGGPRSEGPSREPCRAEWGPHSRRHRHRRRVGWEGREPPPPPPPPPGWAPFAVDAGGPGRGKGGPGGGLGPPPPPPHLRPRAGGAAPAPHCATRGGGGGRRTRSRHPRTSLVCVPGPVSPLGARGWAPAWVSLPAAPLRRSRPLAAVCARIFVVVMRVDECEAPPAPAPRGRWVRARGPPETQAERAARRGDNTTGSPGTGSPSARGLAFAGRGRGESGGPRGNRGARGSGPPGERPLLAGDPARRPGSASERRERRRSGTLLFCRPRIVGSTGQPGHICRRRHYYRAGLGPPKSQRGGGPGWAGRRARAGAGRAGHFLCPAALPRAPLPPRPPPPRTRPARLPRPNLTFRVGRTKKKKFRRRGWRGRARGGWDPALRSDSRAAAVASSSLSSAALDGPARPRGSASLSFPRALPSAPGQVGQRRAGAGARRGLSPAGGPAAWPLARSPRSALVLGGRGPGSSARSPLAAARHTRAHTPSGGSLSAVADGHGH
ncbi:collagen alpha-1(I) chain-like [Equus caballus]|uniref:collagen alpha-1(I) chain-like n=1 Tax=Equus caballus TaxID=9796 RepID=UPI0038B31F69